MIRFFPDQTDRIRYAAAHAYPNECCGLLLGHREGDDIIVDEVVASTNVSDSPRDSFEIDPELRLKIEKIIRGTKRSIIGHYHSHPDGTAEPSDRDKAQVWEPDMVWVVASCNSGGVGETRIFQYDAAQSAFAEAEVGAIAQHV